MCVFLFLAQHVPLQLCNRNWLTGTIPDSLRRLTLLNNLQLQDNRLAGKVPSDLWGLDLLNTLHLSMNPGLG